MATHGGWRNPGKVVCARVTNAVYEQIKEAVGSGMVNDFLRSAIKHELATIKKNTRKACEEVK